MNFVTIFQEESTLLPWEIQAIKTLRIYYINIHKSSPLATSSIIAYVYNPQSLFTNLYKCLFSVRKHL